MENNKNNDIEKKVNGKNSRKRGVLTVVFVLLMALSMASFYGAYNAMYGEGGTAMATPQASEEAQAEETAKVAESQPASDVEVSEDEASSESEEIESEPVETTESSKSTTKKSSQPKQQVIDISITGWGSKTMVYESGDTVYSVLARCGAPVYVEDTVYGLYVVGINGLIEGDKGASSGWTYTVNGSMPMMSAEKCKVNPGDTIAWKFVS